MQKIKHLLKEIPGVLGAYEKPAKMAAKTFEMLYDYAGKNKEAEFSRQGNDLEQCKDRLFTIFAIIDSLVNNYGGDQTVATDAKKLLLLASTPEPEVQRQVINEYPVVTGQFDAVVTQDQAMEIGVMAWWNQ